MRMSFNALNGNVSREGKMFDEALGIPTYISLCSGYDGIGRGLERVIPNLRTIAHCEIEAYAIANLIAKMEEGQLAACPVFTDLKQFPFRELRGKTTILSAGFPCQPFSSAGKRQATEDPRHLWPWIANGVSAMRPRYCFFENVPGIISAKTADGESVLKYVLRDLEQRGYRCTWGIFSAEEVGAPHQRKRVFILGYSERAGLPCSIMGQREEQLGGAGAWDGKVMGNSSSLRPRGGSENCEGEQSEVLGERLESDELADSECCGSAESMQLDTDLSAKPSGCDREEGQELGQTQWPARPGEEQYEWEEPRVVVDSKESRLQGCREPHTKDRRECEKDGAEVLRGSTNTGTHEGVPRSKESTGEAQSKLGRSIDAGQRHDRVDAIANRVDRLRLLGNGDVPQTAELAWKTLWKEMNK